MAAAQNHQPSPTPDGEKNPVPPRSAPSLAQTLRPCLAFAAAVLVLAAPSALAQAPLARPAAAPAGAPVQGERCGACHSQLTAKRFVHPSLLKNDCTTCHRAESSGKGKCLSKTSSKWGLVKVEPDLCYGCHKRLDQSKSVHTAVRQGSCLSCHDPHASNFPRQLKAEREKICFDCHDVDPLLTKPVRHAPVAEGRCLDCHDAHGSDQPNSLVGGGTAFCQRCHDPKAPGGKGAAGQAFRVDLGKKTVHKPLTQKNDCGVCHEVGHSGDHLKLLKKPMLDLCYGCHERQDKNKFPHTAIVAGDCAVCHDPHASDQPKLLAKPTTAAACFTCHQDDLTGRKVVHKPVEKGCDQCHLPHGGPARNLLKGGEGKRHCYTCHQTPVDAGKVKHAALERYGCTGCHDPHGTANGALLPKKVNALCIGCHEAQKDGKHVTPMLPNGHVVGGGNLRDPRRTGREFSCASCHNPHGSNSPHLLYFGEAAMESCDTCHGDKSGKHPEHKNVISKARQDASGAAGGTGGPGGAGTPGGGSGSPGSPGGGSGSPGAGSPGAER